jgi:hypothetical protein
MLNAELSERVASGFVLFNQQSAFSNQHFQRQLE